jgi:hypothetical protein
VPDWTLNPPRAVKVIFWVAVFLLLLHVACNA